MLVESANRNAANFKSQYEKRSKELEAVREELDNMRKSLRMKECEMVD